MHYVLFIYYSHMITVFVVSFDMCHLNNVGVKTLVNLGRRTGALLNTIRPLPPIQGWYGFFILTPVLDVCCNHSRLSLHHEMAGGISARQVYDSRLRDRRSKAAE